MEEENCIFTFQTHLPVSKEEAFAWHRMPGAIQRLTPPFMPVKVMNSHHTLKLDEIVHIQCKILSAINIDCFFKITGYQENEFFIDEQVKGPFSYWKHQHYFKAIDSNNCVIEDIVTFRTPIESFLGALANSKVAKQLHKMFTYRKQILLCDLDFKKKHPSKKLHILMSGANGLIGHSLYSFLSSQGHHVTPITRYLKAGESGLFWDIENQKIDLEQLENCDAVIHLAGENIAGIWSEQKKEKIYKSRIESTKLLVDSFNKLKNPPKTFICASAVGCYPQNEVCNEQSPFGVGFLSGVVKDWEHEATNYKKGRVALMRTGVVLSPKGGFLQKILKLFSLGLGAKIDNGQSHLSWICLDDVVYQYAHVLLTESLHGPINLTSSEIVTNEIFSHTLATLLKRPLFIKIPASIIKAIFGTMGQEMILTDIIAKPEKLLDSKSTFYYHHLDKTLEHLLGIS